MKDRRTSFELPPVWLSWAVGIACLAAILDMPYGFYQFLRLVVTGYAAYVSYVYFRNGGTAIAWTFAFLALIYNPIFPIAMTKGVHAIFNLLAAAAVLGELYLIRSRVAQALPEPFPAVELPLIGPDDRKDFAKFLAREILIIIIVIGGAIGAFYFGVQAYQSSQNEARDYTVAPRD
ncbi:DUF6804 family protein [Sphingopyxis fribergensis]